MLTIYGEVVELESTPLVTCVRDPIEGIRFATLFREVVIDARAIFPYGETLWGPARARYRLRSILALGISINELDATLVSERKVSRIKGKKTLEVRYHFGCLGHIKFEWVLG